jgi:hypothetical protein
MFAAAQGLCHITRAVTIMLHLCCCGAGWLAAMLGLALAGCSCWLSQGWQAIVSLLCYVSFASCTDQF